MSARKTTNKGSLTILELRAQNVKKLTAVRIKTDGNSIVIAGENEAGKSSVLDAIEMALRGKAAIPSQPIREGEEAGSVTLDLGDVIVTRTFTPGNHSLKVTSPDGLSYPSPQAFLDGLFGKRSLDPLAFAEQDADSQEATLRRLARIDTTDLDAEYKRIYDLRTLVNRDVSQAKGAMAKAERFDDIGLDLQTTADIAKQLDLADSLASAATRAESAIEIARGKLSSAESRAQSATDEIDRLRQALERAELASIEADEAVKAAQDELADAKQRAIDTAKRVPDRAHLRQQLESVEAMNTKVRANRQYKALSDQFAEKEREAAGLTAKLNGIEVQKAEMLAAAKFPIEGLGLDTAGVTWNGLPFSQASMAIRIRVSVAIALALHPKLNVLLVRNGNDLGAKNLHLLAQAAEEAGAQLWIERIAGGEGLPTVLIEDGTVAAAKEVAHV